MLVASELHSKVVFSVSRCMDVMHETSDENVTHANTREISQHRSTLIPTFHAQMRSIPSSNLNQRHPQVHFQQKNYRLTGVRPSNRTDQELRDVLTNETEKELISFRSSLPVHLEQKYF